MPQTNDTDWVSGYKNKIPIYAVSQRPPSELETYTNERRGWKEIFHANGNQKKSGIAILVSGKVDFKIKIKK